MTWVFRPFLKLFFSDLLCILKGTCVGKKPVLKVYLVTLLCFKPWRRESGDERICIGKGGDREKENEILGVCTFFIEERNKCRYLALIVLSLPCKVSMSGLCVVQVCSDLECLLAEWDQPWNSLGRRRAQSCMSDVTVYVVPYCELCHCNSEGE